MPQMEHLEQQQQQNVWWAQFTFHGLQQEILFC